MAKHKYKDGSENFFAANFGFIWDCLKVVFKFPPDKDQSYSEFIMEKLGAIAVIIFCVGFLGLLALGIIMDS